MKNGFITAEFLPGPNGGLRIIRGPTRTSVKDYSQRLVAFLDILGFGDLVEGSVVQGRVIPSQVSNIRNILSGIRRRLNNQTHTFDRWTQFSDSIIFSRSPDPEYISRDTVHFLSDLKWIQQELIWGGMLCRGGVTYGHAVHTPSYVFGPAVSRAYWLESRFAKVPRILVDRVVFEAVQRTATMSLGEFGPREAALFVRHHVPRDRDGHYYLDYVGDPESDNYFETYPDFLRRLSEIIIAGGKHTNQRVREKYEWLRTKYERTRRSLLTYATRHPAQAKRRRRFVQKLKQLPRINTLA
jgi:hypothetical protein